MNTEIEVKALVYNIDEVRRRIEGDFSNKDNHQCFGKVESKQLNHYFNHDTKSLYNLLLDITTSSNWESINLPDEIFEVANTSTKNIEVRTRWDDKKGVLLIFKYSLIDNNSANGKVRRELEFPISVSLDLLDEWILNNGLTYKSKWSRDRVEYKFSNFSITTDLNAGYRGLVEVESVLKDSTIELNESFLSAQREILDELGLVELDDNILDAMFKFYNEHWEEYYSTDKSIFDDTRFIYYGYLPLNSTNTILAPY